jgi:hypothetical protein
MKPGDLVKLASWGVAISLFTDWHWGREEYSRSVGDPIRSGEVGLVIAVHDDTDRDEVLVIFGTRVGWRESSTFVRAEEGENA